MSYNSEFYLHPDDKSALDALKAIPGFTRIIKAFMKEFSEVQLRMRCLSSYVRLGENQLPKYKEMLVPICKTLGIEEIPELYLMMDVRPNSFTAGDEHPFIIMTTGLLETLPEELIPAVLAHECGHIACHHVLYRTIGTILFGTVSGTLNAIPLGGLITLPLQMAFYHWMRCSEYSADRAAVLYCGADQVAELCMRLGGYDSHIGAEPNMEAFLDQAREYREMLKDDTGNKAMETLMLANASHPFAAVRALEAVEWAQTDQYKEILAGTYVPPKEEPKETVRSIFDIDQLFKGQDPKTEDKQICPNCGTENTKEARFCRQCGTKFDEKKCPDCGTVLEGTETFCPHCGKKL